MPGPNGQRSQVIHSHISLQGGEVLVWLAGDTRTLRSDAWIHFREYPRHLLERSDFQQFQDSLEGYEASSGLSQFQQNYLQIERLVKKHLPAHMLNRRVWPGELAEWNIIKPGMAGFDSAPGEVQPPKAKKTPAPKPAKTNASLTPLACCNAGIGKRWAEKGWQKIKNQNLES